MTFSVLSSPSFVLYSLQRYPVPPPSGRSGPSSSVPFLCLFFSFRLRHRNKRVRVGPNLESTSSHQLNGFVLTAFGLQSSSKERKGLCRILRTREGLFGSEVSRDTLMPRSRHLMFIEVLYGSVS